MKIVITGGAGFTGINAAEYFLKKNYKIVIFDNLSRVGAAENMQWLKSRFPEVEFVKGDIRHSSECDLLFKHHKDVSLVLHLAAQVAVTRSVTDPRDDFDNNSLGTFNVLEAIRKCCPDCVLIYSSTNKVYGHMDNMGIVESENSYLYEGRLNGIGEDQPLDFYSPYGCSKGCADQYVRDYSRIYKMNTVVFRQSCIYGYRQFGVEDQGWVAWFTIAAANGIPLTIYGDGKQVRDVLFIEDLIAAYEAAFNRRDKAVGQVYNIGGGPNNVLSILQLLNILENLLVMKINVKIADWRPGDQKVYISNIEKSLTQLNWRPAVTVKSGVEKLYNWVDKNREMLLSTLELR